ncbi:hypothetical protein [Isoptericola sp. NPDC057559]|uniref:hypothetical protein n=1 Tax=Isoptericola sp. NPDC057559 TaxID=3346168 RepID=UPI0036D19600
MTTNHARDDWADGRTDEALRRGLDTLAGAGAQASALDAALGDVRRRVRRRRTVKQAGIGATTLALAGALALGGAALLPDPPRPLPGPATTPTPTPSASPTPSDGAARDARGTAGARAVDTIQPGHQPGWLDGTDLSCGMAERDVPDSPAGYRLVLDDPDDPRLGGAVADGDGATITLPARFTRDAGTPAGTVLLGPSLVWAQDGRVVDLGIDRTEEPLTLSTGETSRDAEDYATSTCDPGGIAEGTTAYPNRLPDGDYHVRAFAVVWSPEHGSTVVTSPRWRRVVLDDDGARLSSAADRVSAEGECSATGLDVLDPDLTDVPEPARTTVATMFTAALSCDDETLIALAEASGRVGENWDGRSPRELLELPAAERDEDVYAVLARLLSETRPCIGEVSHLGGLEELYAWPRMAQPCEAAAPDWQDAVDAGALTAQESADMQAADGGPAYEGWRLTVDGQGRWTQLVDGYLGPPRD